MVCERAAGTSSCDHETVPSTVRRIHGHHIGRYHIHRSSGIFQEVFLILFEKGKVV